MEARVHTKRAAWIGALALLGCGDNQTVAPSRLAYEAGAAEPLACVPNLDGKIEAKEIQPAIDVPVSYLVSAPGQNRAIALVPVVDAQGRNSWDLSAAQGDKALRIAAQTLTGKWYQASFPAQAFVAPFDAAGRIEGIYVHGPESIALLGLASREENAPEGKTLLVYGEPVVLYRLPVQVGQAFTSVGQVRDATLRGQPYAGRDTYDVKVDAAGRVALPDLTFTQAIRVKTKVTLEPVAGKTIVRRQTSFMFECFGEVARATSLDDEPNEDFSVAAEVRRLGL
jgi:hypothetical protein